MPSAGTFNRILNTITKNEQKPIVSLIRFGTITEIDYDTKEIVKIQVDGSEILPAEFFEISDNCRRRCYNGDRVRLLQFNNSQKYYVSEVLRDDPILCYGRITGLQKGGKITGVFIEGLGQFGEEWLITSQNAYCNSAIGDTVMMLSTNKGLEYYILEVMIEHPSMFSAVYVEPPSTPEPGFILRNGFLALNWFVVNAPLIKDESYIIQSFNKGTSKNYYVAMLGEM